MNLCESVTSVGLFFCPTDYTDKHGFFVYPRAKSFCLVSELEQWEN